MAKPQVLQNADPIAGTLPHFSQDLYQAVYFATAIADSMVILQVLQKYMHEQNS
jgi:hypothetical protein